MLFDDISEYIDFGSDNEHDIDNLYPYNIISNSSVE